MHKYIKNRTMATASHHQANVNIQLSVFAPASVCPCPLPSRAGTSALGHSANKPQETHNYTPLETDPLECPPVARPR